MKYLAVAVPKNNEFSYEQAFAFFSSISSSTKSSSILSLFKNPQTDGCFSFNILSAKQRIRFIVVVDDAEAEPIKNQILAQYTSAQIKEIPAFNFKTKYFYELEPSAEELLPIKTASEFRDVDPLASLLSAISRTAEPNAIFWLQIIVSPVIGNWQEKASAKIDALSKVEQGSSQTQSKRNLIQQIQEKIKYPGHKVSIRILSNTKANLNLFYSSFSIFAGSSGNRLSKVEPTRWNRTKLIDAANNHIPAGKSFILNSMELATLWHLPNKDIRIPNIEWGKKLNLESPQNLPVPSLMSSEEEKDQVTVFAKTDFKNAPAVFGIKQKDRLKHMYFVGKTGTGKSTLLANMAIDDIRKGHGIAFLDPHGDTIKHILEYIPKKRINDVCYFNPADPEYAYPLNILEVPNSSQKELMVSGIISIFHKLYGHSWGPRLEYILRNALFTLSSLDDATLADVISLLVDKDFRKRIVSKLDDQVLKQFWEKEFDRMDPKLQTEAISPILNKVGQFVTSPLIRKIINHKKSKVRIDKIMNEGKILLCDLSQGKIGEDNATLLGSMIITLIQVHTMNRAFLPEEERKVFFLYVDEFQNFATPSFIKILSEARKYKLALTLANQYMNQIDPDVLNAILGNAGTLATLAVGNQDSLTLSREFGASMLLPEDLASLERFQMVLRMSIDMETSAPFAAYSLPLPKNVSGQTDKIIEASRRNYGKKL